MPVQFTSDKMYEVLSHWAKSMGFNDSKETYEKQGCTFDAKGNPMVTYVNYFFKKGPLLNESEDIENIRHQMI